jgi:hypothetical protein
MSTFPFYVIPAASAARGASPQKHVYIHYMSMFVIIYVQPNSMTVLCFVVYVRFSYIYTAHQQTTTCFKIDFFQTFFEFFRWNFKMRGDGNHGDEQV